MDEGVPPARTDGLTQAAIRPTVTPAGPPSSPIPPGMVLGYLDLAIRGALEYERYAAVYLSPWWDVPDVPEDVFAWKRAVLERIPHRGAKHWGHLYLVVSDAPPTPGRFRIFGRSWRGEIVPERPHETRFQLRRGHQLADLIAQPSRPEGAESLGGFAREVEERFRRQMD